MKISNLIKRLEKYKKEVSNYEVTYTKTQWGYHAEMKCIIGDYYNVEVIQQIHADTLEEAEAAFYHGDISYFCSKPWHDQSDSMSDYCAWSFDHKLKDIDWLVEQSKTRDMKRVATPVGAN